MNNESKNHDQGSLAWKLTEAEDKIRKENGTESADNFTKFIGETDPAEIKSRALKMGETAPDFTLKNALGKAITLSAEIKRGPVILTWYRGGWCPYCNLALAYLQRFLKQFKEAGAELIAITPEKPDETLTIKEKHDLEFEILTDENNEIAKLYGGVHRLNKEVKDFYKDRGVFDHYTDDIQEFPVPATYIISPQGTVIYAFVESDYRQRAEPTFIIGAIKQYQKQHS
ncbi:redoxin domain-containing protein [Mucilaginibacter sabulilitoris]|uniref:thioredoxin-dependent peroxiredoxin n=1 Tax=Mucilaginibacter sabulilitoris TaxID=1173583 RepID=A0ABZ0TV17_9SPHI|nr:redoxin domain-containing protein [Mucilaginibacter sabulilitoris]WPU96941.1 redoxin domain-containing protein [Mucilaginibacter sabulilitoris]